jgi:hypothetical protein
LTSPLNNDAEPAALRERVAMLEPNSGDMAERDRLAAEVEGLRLLQQALAIRDADQGWGPTSQSCALVSLPPDP